MSNSYTAKYITAEKSILTEEQKQSFNKEFAETSEAQASYEQIIARLMKNKEIDARKASSLTGLNENLFKKLNESGGCVQKRFIISIAVGFQLDVHLTEYILESCGMKFCESSRVDKAYIFILENCKGRNIEDCNGILRDFGIEGKDMLGELERGGYKTKRKAK